MDVQEGGRVRQGHGRDGEGREKRIGECREWGEWGTREGGDGLKRGRGMWRVRWLMATRQKRQGRRGGCLRAYLWILASRRRG